MKSLNNAIIAILIWTTNQSFADVIQCNESPDINFSITKENQITNDFDFAGTQYHFETITLMPALTSKTDPIGILLMIRQGDQIVAQKFQYNSNYVDIVLKDKSGQELKCKLRYTHENGPLTNILVLKWNIKLNELIHSTKFFKDNIDIMKYNSGQTNWILEKLKELHKFRTNHLRYFISSDEYGDLFDMIYELEDLVSPNRFEANEFLNKLNHYIEYHQKLIQKFTI